MNVVRQLKTKKSIAKNRRGLTAEELAALEVSRESLQAQMAEEKRTFIVLKQQCQRHEHLHQAVICWLQRCLNVDTTIALHLRIQKIHRASVHTLNAKSMLFPHNALSWPLEFGSLHN